MRGKRSKKRLIEPDSVYKSKVISRMINILMLGGKRSTAEGILYAVLKKVSEDNKEAAKFFEEAVKNVMPIQEVRSRRVGGATYQVPMPLKHDRSEALALRWIIGAARRKSGKSMEERLYEEIKNAHEGMGDAIKKREDTHKMAEANRAFAHFARV
ncbi:30S ribosomal protein S7 [candidate division WWE3 bacterium RBG_13_37_7]|uniref:Small ribosomal subunit protein uS7 n=1 Tax=candidate division WWE3 bacterium RBG_13_37_7 TaxID=1802609 RepID=A0A1F4U0B1_UNCKA|nr:MAG: 30S ribosomal protein S7 [candidate division WWE3 bacterium RBG_13_37_7]